MKPSSMTLCAGMSSSLSIFRRSIMALAIAGAVTQASADTDTTATFKGHVNVPGAQVEVTYEPNGLTKSIKLESGETNFSFSFLPVGGPYKVVVTAPGFEETTVEDIYLVMYQNDVVDINLATQGSIDTVLVLGTKTDVAQGFGTGTTLNRYSIDGIPSVQRSIGDYARLDPRINLNDGTSNGLEISAMGANNRFNDFQIDGVSFNDAFGLNANGFGTMRNPISMDFVQNMSVDITPFDVTRGNATGASISVVTKSGTNEFDGSIYYTKRDESNVGDLPNGSPFPPFEEELEAYTFSGPIIRDRLFFFLGYETMTANSPFNYGPRGSGAINESEAATSAVFEQIANISKSVYGFDPGSFQGISTPETHDEYVGKVDFYLNDSNRFEGYYSYSEDQLYQNVGGNKFDSVFYVKPPQIERYSLTWYSDLTENLRAKAKYTRYELTEDASSPGGTFPEVSITYEDANGRDFIYLGGEKYRAANFINVKSDFYTFKFDYDMDSHVITAGYDREESALLNTFLARYNGEIRFNSIADFEAGNWSYLRFNVPTAGLTDLDSISAKFDVEKNTFYVQDVWNVSELLTLQFGLRYDQVKTPTAPVRNPTFEARYGYTNAQTFDYSQVLPRISFNYDLSDAIDHSLVNTAELRGGVGLFLGRFPNVWLGNAYSRPGPLSDYRTYSKYNSAIGPMPAANAYDGSPRFFWLNSPASSYAISNTYTTDQSQYVDPNFQGPTSWRGNLALDLNLGEGYEISLEYNMDRVKEGLAYRDPGLTRTGTMADGRGIYTTSGSLELTNTSQGSADAFTLSLRKTFLDSINLFAAYTHTDAKDVWNLTSSQAESNYGYQQRYDGDNLQETTSAYNVEHRLLVTLDWAHDFIGNNETRVSMIWNRSSGEPYSVTYDNTYGITGAFGHYGGYDLAYIPTGVDDPKVKFSSPEVANEVMAAINSSHLAAYKGTVPDRNAFNSPWQGRLDLRVTQEINFGVFSDMVGENKAMLFLDIVNFGNLLDSGSGIRQEYSYNTSRQIVTNGFDKTTGQPIITGVDLDDNLFTGNGDGQSSWSMRLGLKYQF